MARGGRESAAAGSRGLSRVEWPSAAVACGAACMLVERDEG